MKLRFVDWFAGIGGFRLGLELAGGFECVCACEIDKHRRMIYRFHWGEDDEKRGVPLFADSRTVDVAEVPRHDLFCAGFPCQSFSVAGKRKGFADTRGVLFFEICRIVGAKKPRYLLLENVKGLLSLDKGSAFQTVLRSLDELGYDLQWAVLDSRHFGVPQRRQRVFIVGHLRGTPRPEVFPLGERPEAHSEDGGQEGRDRLETALCLRAGTRQRYDGETLILRRVGTVGRGLRGQRIYSTGGLAVALSAEGGGWGAKTGLYLVKDGNLYSVRKLTPLECERLQGFPDGWTRFGKTEGGETVPMSDTQRYKALGDAVTVPVVASLGRKLKESFGRSDG